MAARARGLSGPAAGPLGRRALLGAALAGTASACGGGSSSPPRSTASPRGRGVQRLAYGDDRTQQVVDVRRPRGGARAPLTVVLVHGGYWQASYGLDLMVPMAERLTASGLVTANVEYRRVGSGGGWPATFEDVAAAVDVVAAQDDLPSRTVLLGHSAGGHLAVWAGSRTSATPGGRPRRRPERVVSLSGLLDLTAAASAPESGAAVLSLMGGTPAEHPDRYRLGDPARLVPAACPVVAVQDSGETVIPVDQAADYVRAARLAGGTAQAVTVPGDHFTLIDPTAASWPRIERLVTAGGR